MNKQPPASSFQRVGWAYSPTSGSRWAGTPTLRVILVLALMVCVLAAPGAAFGQRKVNIPPPDSKPPPAAKAPPRTQTSGEETDIMDGMGPTMRKTQERQPPPPTSLTVMYKVQYGEKLQYLYPDGRQETFDQWESFKNDGSQIMHFANERLADGNNYQYAVRPLAAGGFDPVDIPLLYMTGDYDFTLGEAEVKNLRKFILDGGTILFNAARGLDEFNIAVVREMRKVFPQKTFMKLPPDHPIYNGRYRIKDLTMLVNGVQMLKAPEIYSLDIGTRAAVILVPGGLGTAWSEGQYFPAGKHIVGESAVRLGVNLVSYVLGITEYGKFLAQEFPIYAGKTKPGDVVRFAEARYTGSWDDNPALQNSLLQGLKENTEIDVDYAPRVVDLADAKIGNYPLVFMTGHYDFELSPEEAQNLHNYLARGGMLVASAAAGLKPFDTAFRREMKRVLPDAQLVKLPPSHPLFAMGWNAIGRVAYTPPAQRDDPTLEYPAFYGLFVDDRLVVLYTPFDFQSALNHESNAYAKGLTPDDALRIAINIMTYSLSH